MLEDSCAKCHKPAGIFKCDDCCEDCHHRCERCHKDPHSKRKCPVSMVLFKHESETDPKWCPVCECSDPPKKTVNSRYANGVCRKCCRLFVDTCNTRRTETGAHLKSFTSSFESHCVCLFLLPNKYCRLPR